MSSVSGGSVLGGRASVADPRGDRARDALEGTSARGVPHSRDAGRDLSRFSLIETRRRRSAWWSVRLKPLPWHATQGWVDTVPDENCVTSSPVPRQGTQPVVMGTGGATAVGSSSSSSAVRRRTGSACVSPLDRSNLRLSSSPSVPNRSAPHAPAARGAPLSR